MPNQVTRQNRAKTAESRATRVRGTQSEKPLARNESGAAAPVPKTVRKRSQIEVFGLPLWEIASGPDRANGETRGHARAIFAIGDVADGVVALGGISRGIISIGGVALGAVTLGGVSVGLLASVGGVAVAPLAYGGAAVGGVAVGGAALGIYAKGDSAAGLYALDKRTRHPEAVRFFGRWLPRL